MRRGFKLHEFFRCFVYKIGSAGSPTYLKNIRIKALSLCFCFSVSPSSFLAGLDHCSRDCIGLRGKASISIELDCLILDNEICLLELCTTSSYQGLYSIQT